jgi:transcriptional regulator with XRE-family HTH domain
VTGDLDPLQSVLRNERKRQGLTMQTLGNLVGHSTYQGIWQWENRNCPSLANARTWANALGYDLALVPLDPQGE